MTETKNIVESIKENKPSLNKNTNKVIPVEEFTGESNVTKPVEWTYNKGTWDSYRKNHIDPPDTLDLQEREFLRKVKV